MEQKKQQLHLKAKCIIHQASTGEEEHLVSPQNFASWQSLLEAARLRNCTKILEAAKDLKEGEIPDPHHHRKCRSLFTMKRDLESLKHKADETFGDRAGTSDCSLKRTSRRFSSVIGDKGV